MSKKGERVTRICKNCNKEFSVLKSTLKTNASGNFCCRPCYNEYQKTLKGAKNNHYTRVETKCPTCGKTLLVIPSKLKANKNCFCSKKCKNEYMYEYIGGEKNCNWTGGCKAFRGNFDEVKRKYFSGVNYCAICGTTHDIHIHHIIPYRLTQDNELDNLIPLCRKHHKIVEAVSVKFLNITNDYKTAKFLLNNILRSRQGVTMYLVNKREKNERTKNS